jgi:hypothetical protein
MSSDSSLWYRVGYAMEQARQLPSTGRRGLAGLRERAADDPVEERGRGGVGGASEADRSGEGAGRREGASRLPLDDAVATGAVAVAARLLDRWRPGGATGLGGILWAGAAGAAATLLLELAAPLLSSDGAEPALDASTPERLLTGSAQGMVYGAVLEPWLPGPPVLKGVLFGSAEFLLHPSGGATRVLGSRSPLGRVPMVLTLLEQLEARDRSFLEHVAFGAAVGVLYGSRSSSGTVEVEEA